MCGGQPTNVNIICEGHSTNVNVLYLIEGTTKPSVVIVDDMVVH